MFAASGILFNHESPLRGLEFVTRKITDSMANPEKVRRDLGWEPETTLEALCQMMVEADRLIIRSGLKVTDLLTST